MPIQPDAPYSPAVFDDAVDNVAPANSDDDDDDAIIPRQLFTSVIRLLGLLLIVLAIGSKLFMTSLLLHTLFRGPTRKLLRVLKPLPGLIQYMRNSNRYSYMILGMLRYALLTLSQLVANGNLQSKNTRMTPLLVTMPAW